MSDSREERQAADALPADLDEWLDERAAALSVDRDELVRQLLAAYRTAEGNEDDLGEPIEAAIDERLDSAADAVADRFEGRLEELEREFQSKVVDVRERVIQVKKEADGKAPADHDHEELAATEDFRSAVADLEAAIDDLEDRHETAVAEIRDDLAEGFEDAAAGRAAIDERLDDATDKLRRVAWVVSDLRDDVGDDDAHDEAVARIKRAAAQEGVTSATCQGCGESVDVALLTAPECPHCEATVSDVRPSGGILRKKARLVAAAQLESGEEDG